MKPIYKKPSLKDLGQTIREAQGVCGHGSVAQSGYPATSCNNGAVAKSGSFSPGCNTGRIPS